MKLYKLVELMRVSSRISLLFIIFFCNFIFVQAQGIRTETYASSENDFQVENLLTNLAYPWSIALIEDAQSVVREAFVTLRSGVLYFLTNIPAASSRSDIILNEVRGLPPVAASGQGGLLDIILAENYNTNKRIYFSASTRNGVGLLGTSIFTAVFNEQSLQLQNVEVIFSLERFSRSTHHFGSRLVLGPGGDLFVSIGDRGEPERAQNTRDAAGSIVRIPLNENGLASGAYEIYSYGHRNIQGLIYDESINSLIAHEHGPRGGDEINLIREGANYGWPLVSYGINYNGSPVSDYTSLPGIVEPLLYWDPSIAPSGFAKYPSSGVFAQENGEGWSDQLFVGALAGRHLRRVQLPTHWETSSLPLQEQTVEEELLAREVGRIRDIRIDNRGYIYILTDGGQASLLRLVPVP